MAASVPVETLHRARLATLRNSTHLAAQCPAPRRAKNKIGVRLIFSLMLICTYRRMPAVSGRTATFVHVVVMLGLSSRSRVHETLPTLGKIWHLDLRAQPCTIV